MSYSVRFRRSAAVAIAAAGTCMVLGAVGTCSFAAQTGEGSAGKVKPLMRDFMGLNVHSMGFKYALYEPVCRLLRDYHSVSWDLGPDTSVPPAYPMTNNGLNWVDEYGSWVKAGFVVDASLMFEGIPVGKYHDLAHDTYAYGKAIASFMGPSSPHPLVSSFEVGNEPGNYSDADYRTVFENMAKGIREGDPKAIVVTCNAVPGAHDQYTKGLECIAGLQSLYDVLNVHTYAFVTGWPTWRRSYPEDPTIKYLNPINQTIAWRDSNAPGKQIWVTEFGYDSTTKPNLPTGDFAKWVGVTDTQQAEYIVRSFLVFSSMDVDRAYLYYFNDNDQPTLHASSGLTRNDVPKPSYWAMAHLYKTLAWYRFQRAVAKETGSEYAFEYVNGRNKKMRIWAVWSPTGTNVTKTVDLPAPKGQIYRAEQMPLEEGQASVAPYQVLTDGKVRVTIGEAPIYLWIRG